MLDVRIWDVGHGLSIRMRTPAGQNHLIDAGANGDFSPAKHIRQHHWRDGDVLNYLVISHPDQDHIQDLPNVVKFLGEPKTLLRNKTLPPEEKYGLCQHEYQKAFRELDEGYNVSTDWSGSPRNPEVNGGMIVESGYLNWEETGNSKNNSSVVILYLYAGTLFVFPGDIEDTGWISLWDKRGSAFQRLINAASTRVLVAPHHGRSSGYSELMMDVVQPHLCVVSDEHGKAETDRRFREKPIGMQCNGQLTKYFTTKTFGRVQLVAHADGRLQLL